MTKCEALKKACEDTGHSIRVALVPLARWEAIQAALAMPEDAPDHLTPDEIRVELPDHRGIKVMSVARSADSPFWTLACEYEEGDAPQPSCAPAQNSLADPASSTPADVLRVAEALKEWAGTHENGGQGWANKWGELNDPPNTVFAQLAATLRRFVPLGPSAREAA